MSATLQEPETTLPPVSAYWNPGEETARERLKLQALHQVSHAGGILRHVFGRLAKSSVGILTYHRIADTVPGVPFPTINVTPAAFRAQLMGLKRAGFQFASLVDVLAASEEAAETGTISLPERTVVVTFDDIYDCVFQNAWPVLQELQIPVTCFISTAFVDSTEPFLFDPWARKHRANIPTEAWRPITDAHLREMLRSDLVDVGAHTHTHQDFRDRPADFAVDVARGMEELQQNYGLRNMPFAFPYGAPRMGFCNESLMNVVRDSGLLCGLTTGSHTNGINTSPFGWGRFHVFEHDTGRSLAAKLDGWYEWLPQIKTRLSQMADRNAWTICQQTSEQN